MLIKKISFATCLEDITDIENNNIDVFVELENSYIYFGCSYTKKY